jgi:hypothetical protein
MVKITYIEAGGAEHVVDANVGPISRRNAAADHLKAVLDGK